MQGLTHRLFCGESQHSSTIYVSVCMEAWFESSPPHREQITDGEPQYGFILAGASVPSCIMMSLDETSFTKHNANAV